MKTQHEHDYKKGRGSVDVCACGRFKHNEKAGPAIIGVPALRGQHTQGPWLINQNRKNDENIRALVERQIEGTNTYVVDEIIIATANEDLTNYRANARLISCAPELLEALEKMVERMKIMVGDNQILFKKDHPLFEGMKIINKAKGEL